MRTCRYLYDHCLPKYYVKKEVIIYYINQYPTSELGSTRRIPILGRIYCHEESLDDLRATRVNPNQIKSLRMKSAKVGAFDKLPKS